ncbi:spore germination protein [Lederbergia wuyishanensis]|uniref:Spore germination protein n=1 Tax=Lederbergia wuyishanensis TaxID=1347903 RepID=A0ABU0DAB3_9BACI|nr:spore germination protein [Lederbergia wuyishanensis]MCJ8009972.1 spore germination protein [Lederbergia wuyishanensis]MDQ0345320.1 spore germination protein [Lederbergia wuyishanensis]
MLKKAQKLVASSTVPWIIEKLKPTFDFTHKPLQIDNKQIELLYIKTVVNGDKLYSTVIKPFFEMQSLKNIEAYFNSLPNQQEVQSKDQLLVELTKGSVLIVIKDNILLFDFKQVHLDVPLPTNVEPTIQGPQYALSEDLITNINMIRQRYHQPSLRVEMYSVGKKVHQSVAIIYDEAIVKKDALKEIKSKIKDIEKDLVLASADLIRCLNSKKRSLLPTTILTERTDRISYNLSGGKVIIIMDGDSNAILAPAVFFDFMTSMEDEYHPYWVSKFTSSLRYIGFFSCIALPGLYVGLTSYNPDIVRVELALSVAGSRVGVPYPSYIEVFIMLIVMEFLTEASIRLPKAVSATATTVGGLILGTAVTEAALASNILIIIVSAVAISTFVIPINEMSFAIRVSRYVVLIFTTIAGMTGLALALIGLVMWMANKSSYGEAYFKLFIQGKNKET